MLLYLTEYLAQFESGFNVFSYLTMRAILGALTALLLSFIIGPRMIAKLSVNQVGQPVREEGPDGSVDSLELLDANNGEIWAKLDAGTEEHYRRVARSAISFGRILRNLEDAARSRPIVIQSLFMRIHGDPPEPTEQESYCQRLLDVVAAGGLEFDQAVEAAQGGFLV